MVQTTDKNKNKKIALSILSHEYFRLRNNYGGFQ